MMRFPEETFSSVYFTYMAQAALFVFLFLGLLFRISELILFCTTMLMIGAGAWLWSAICRRGVTCRVEADKTRLFPGQSFTIGIHVINDKFLPTLVHVNLGVTQALAGLGGDQSLTEQVGLLWYQRLYFSKTFQPQKRGVYQLGPPWLRLGDLLGFFPREKRGSGELEVLVYPRIVPLKPLALPKKELYGMPGVNNPVEDPVLIYGARDYQAGSPARRILWKASARLDKLQEKLCEPAEQEKVLVLIDVAGFEAARARDEFERALEVAASLLVDLDRKGFATGLVTNGTAAGGGTKIVPISKNDQQTALLLELLARMQMRSDGALHELLTRGYALPWGVSCIYLSHAADQTALRTKSQLNMGRIPVRILDADTLAREVHTEPADIAGTGPGATP